MVGKFKLVVIAVRITILETIKVVVNKGRVMEVIDIPVQANHVFLTVLNSVTWLATGIVVVNILRNAFDTVEIGLAEPVTLFAIAGSRIAFGKKTRQFKFFVGSKDKKLVFDDRTANVETIGCLVV